jgi:hypothetical protein
VTPEFFIVGPEGEGEGEEGKRPESTAASNSPSVLAAPPTPPKLPRHELALLPVLFKESGTAFAAGHAIKCPYSRGRHWEQRWRERCAAAELRQWFCGPTYRSLSTLVVAACWFWCWTIGFTALLATCDTDRCWRRRQGQSRTARSQVKPRRGGGMPDIFLRHCAVCARVGEESVNRTGFLEADPRLAIQSPSTSPTSVVSLQNNPTFVIT